MKIETMETLWAQIIATTELKVKPLSLTRRKTKVRIPSTKTLDLAEAIKMEAWIQPKSFYIGNGWKQRPSILAKVRPITKREIYPAAFTVFNHKNGLVEKSTCRNLLVNESM